jgi:hypothetical protein
MHVRRTLLIILLLAGAIRIAATWNVFSETADEPMHLAAGLQVLTDGEYALQLQNPPLPRVLIAIGPWLGGARYDRAMDVLSIFHSTGRYKTTLVLARAGTLVFFLIAALATWAWARRELGEIGALVTLAVFTTQPSVLGHAGLATLDVAGVAGVAVSLLACSRWIEHPTVRRAAVVGAAYGFAILGKLLCIAYVPLACGAMYAVHLLRYPAARAQWQRILTLGAVPPVAALLVWAGYGFNVEPLVRGITEMIAVNREGYPSYALGRTTTEGWWWYFPLTLGLKTTIATLILVVAGFVLAPRKRAFQTGIAAAAAILGFSMTTNVDIGIRYILPIYVPLSLAIAVTIMAIARHRQQLVRVAGALLLAWHLVASTIAHPDYLAYFNELAGDDPSRYLADSNLDWGQDVLRLRDVVREEKISRIGLHLMGPADPARLGFPPHYHVHPWGAANGWLAISDHAYRVVRAGGGWSWLRDRPYRRVGKSIRLYYPVAR